MHLTVDDKTLPGRRAAAVRSIEKIWKMMRIMAILLFAACLQVSARSYGQNITLSVKNASLQSVLGEIKKQSGYQFFFNEGMLAKAKAVTLDVKDTPLGQVLRLCFQDQPFSYSIVAKTVVVRDKAEEKKEDADSEPPPADIHGRITDSLGNPLAGASIFVKGTKKGTISEANGNFTLKGVNENQTLVISFTGYAKTELKVNGTDALNVSLSKSNNSLDAVVVIPYGTTTQRLNTGDISTVTAKTIEQQPVSNVLGALEGQVPGLLIVQQSGLPGGAFKVQIRGQNSIANGGDPFYVVDGVPYNSQILNTGLLNQSLQGGSPLSYLNPFDIESVEVLKDADATAIYGTRAANGAILITTKKGKEGSMKFNLNVSSGLSTPGRDMKLMNTQQYLTMRNQAFSNDGQVPGPADYDINGVWDTTRYANWPKVLTQNKARYTTANASFSGGNANTQYLIGGGYNYNATGFPTLLSNQGSEQSGSLHLNVTSFSPNRRFRISLTGSYESNKNTVQYADFTGISISLPPDAPPIFNADGSLNWAPLVPGQAGTFSNPYANLYVGNKSLTSNVVANTTLSYTLLKGLELRASMGYTNTQTDEVQTYPTTINDPGTYPTTGSSFFNTNNTHSWIVEPQIEYRLNLGQGVFNALVGGSFHENNAAGTEASASGFISDALLEDIQAASSVSQYGFSSQYKYEAFFGRLNYDWQDKYLLNITGRRDGSSRFGPGKQFANFGAVGAAWIFTRENFVKENLPFLSFGKIRGSFGNTGNDQVGDYRFIDLYQPTSLPYQGLQGLYPQNLFNPDLAWETTTKLEGGIELGFLKDRITVQASVYQNRSKNQVVQTPITVVTGFGNIVSNLPAVVQNAGVEFVLNAAVVKSRDFSWQSIFNISFSKNKLISFDNLAGSPYKNTLIIGKPISVLKAYVYSGINDTTGVYQFAGAQGTTTYNPGISDPYALVNLTPQYYGGWQNNFSYKGFTLNVFFQFTKQTGTEFFAASGSLPGTMNNQPEDALNRWQAPGDKNKYEKFSQDYSGSAYNAVGYARSSTFAYGDASYIRLKNAALAWQLPQAWNKKMHFDNCQFFVNVQNLLTISSYEGLDPESQGAGTGPRRTWAAGFQIGF